MLIFEQGYSEDRWTDFNAQYLKTRVSARSAYLWGQNDNFTILRGQNPPKLPKLAWIYISQPNREVVKQPYIRHRWNYSPQIWQTDWKREEISKIRKIWSKRVTWGSRDPFLKFWDSLISRERLKLETSNLAQRWTTVSSNENNCKIRSKGVTWESRDPLLEIGTPLSPKRLKLGTSNLV